MSNRYTPPNVSPWTVPASRKNAQRRKRVWQRLAAPPGTVVIFTDGACLHTGGPAALGVAIDGLFECGEFLSNSATNNLAELAAILRALQLAPHEKRRTIIYSDSMYAIGVLSLGWKAQVHVPLIRYIQREMSAFADLSLAHIPGHSGYAGNELADRLAGIAMRSRFPVSPLAELHLGEIEPFSTR